ISALLIGRAASLTKNIRVGSGGIMLANHAHIRVAEEFSTLAQMYPNRIDLGLGRAPGTDGMTSQLITRTSGDAREFANNIYDMIGWFSEDGVSFVVPTLMT